MRTLVIFAILTISASPIGAEPPKLSGEVEDYTGLSDYFRVVKCNIAGEDITYEWFHNDVRVESTSSKFFVIGSMLAAKSPVTQFHQGTYQCKASNKDGTLLGPKIKVYFTIVGTFIKSHDTTEAVNAVVGMELTLACPPRTLSQNIYYHWGGRQGTTGAWFMPSRKHYVIMEDGSLLFANVKDEDIEYFNVQKNGVSCSMESKGDIKQFSFSQRFLLQETGVKNTVPFGPNIKTVLKDREVARGTEFVILRCGAVGLPTPDYSWTVTGLDGVEREIINGKDGYQRQDFNHILMINSVETKHDGWYKCRVSSTYEGRHHTDEMKGRISVKGKPEWATDGKLLAVSPTEGNEFKWVCEAFGNPLPSYSWLFNGEKLTSSDSYDIDGGMITFKSISKTDAGLYQCVAENSFGNVSSSAELKMMPAPTIAPLEKCNVTNMNVMFLVDGSGSVPMATFKEFKTFMQLLVMKFTVGAEATHVGVLQYSSKPRTGLEFAPGEYQTIDAIQHAISNVKYHYGAYTYGGYAMGMARELLKWYSHRNAKNIMILLMDQGTWDKRVARKHSQELREKGTQIIILDTSYSHIMHDIADMGLEFKSDNLKNNVERVARKICT